MEKFINEYFEKTNFPVSFREKVERAYKFYNEYIKIEIKDIFITDHIDSEGKRNYENLWFFSDKYMMEAKNFLKKDDFDCYPIKVRSWTIKFNDYLPNDDFTDKSRLQFVSHMEYAGVVEIKASKENCELFMSIFKKYFNYCDQYTEE